MTVALGPKGNNFILGGKISQISAEQAYTVRISLTMMSLKEFSLAFVVEFHNSHLWQGGCIRCAQPRFYGTKAIRQDRAYDRQLQSIR